MSENTLALYECAAIIAAIEERAAANDGEISESDLQALVVAQTQSMDKLGKLCGYIRHLEGGIDLCKTEEARIKAMRTRAENRLESIKKFLTPFVSEYRKSKGHPLTVGTFKLFPKAISKVETDDSVFFTDENKAKWCRHKESWEPNKDDIGAAIEAGTQIVGARVVKGESLQVR